MTEVEVRFGRKVRTGDYETATFEITAKAETGGTDAFAKIPELFAKLENEVEQEITKFKEGLKQIPIPKAAPAAAPAPATITTTKRKESDLPVSCAIKSNGTDKKIMFYIQDNSVLNPAKVIIGKITPAENGYGTYYKFSNDKSAILTRTKSGSWLMKKRSTDGRYEVAGHVSINFGAEK